MTSGRRIDSTSAWGAVARSVVNGIPGMVSGLVLLLVPLMGRNELTDRQYAVWALLATLMNAGVLFDLGGSSYLLAHGYRNISRRAVGRACGVSVAAGLVLGFLAIAVWKPITGRYLALSETILPLAISILVIVGRSILTVLFAAMQVNRSFALRSYLMLGQALGQTVLCWVLLRFEFSLLALPSSAALSVLLTATISVLWFFRDFIPVESSPEVLKISVFARVRIIGTLCGLLLTQFDRWIIGLVGSAAFLSDYDVALRLGVLPKSIVIALMSGLVVESASNSHQWEGVTRRAIGLTASLSVVGSLGIFVAACLAPTLGVQIISTHVLVMLAFALTWNTLNSLTGPITAMCAGRGVPQAELQYLVPTCITAIIGWGIGIALHDVNVMFLATFISMSGWSVWFVVRHWPTRAKTISMKGES